MATPSSMRIAEARVDLSSAKYLRFARKVSWPGAACSMPATPEISRSGGPSRRQFSFWASSESFMEALLKQREVQTLKAQEFRRKGKNKDNAETERAQRRGWGLKGLSGCKSPIVSERESKVREFIEEREDGFRRNSPSYSLKRRG